MSANSIPDPRTFGDLRDVLKGAKERMDTDAMNGIVLEKYDDVCEAATKLVYAVMENVGFINLEKLSEEEAGQAIPEAIRPEVDAVIAALRQALETEEGH